MFSNVLIFPNMLSNITQCPLRPQKQPTREHPHRSGLCQLRKSLPNTANEKGLVGGYRPGPGAKMLWSVIVGAVLVCFQADMSVCASAAFRPDQADEQLVKV